MNKLILPLLLVLVCSSAFGGTADQLLAEINLARTAPRAYAAKVQAQSGNVRSRRSLAEAIAFLKNATPLPPLQRSSGLTLAAQSQVATQGPAGRLGHGAFGSRISRQGEYVGLAGENIAYGRRSAASTVVAWIVDEGHPSRGHRTNIFRRDFAVAGCAVGGHARYGKMAVTDFAGGFVDKGRTLAVR